jgi:hypothetical protein
MGKAVDDEHAVAAVDRLADSLDEPLHLVGVELEHVELDATLPAVEARGATLGVDNGDPAAQASRHP